MMVMMDWAVAISCLVFFLVVVIIIVIIFNSVKIIVMVMAITIVITINQRDPLSYNAEMVFTIPAHVRSRQVHALSEDSAEHNALYSWICSGNCVSKQKLRLEWWTFKQWLHDQVARAINTAAVNYTEVTARHSEYSVQGLDFRPHGKQSRAFSFWNCFRLC